MIDFHRFWTEWIKVEPKMDLHSIAVRGLLGIPTIAEATYRLDIAGCVCRNPLDGRVYYSIYNEKPNMRAPCNSIRWAQLLAEHAAEERPHPVHRMRVAA